jgi:hypothetical protein
MDQCVFDNLRKTLPECTSEGTIVPANKALAEAKLDDIDCGRTCQSEHYEPTFMVGNFVKVTEYRYHGTFEGGKRDEFWGRRDWPCLVRREDGSESVVCKPTKMCTGPEDLFGLGGKAFWFVKELDMASTEEFVELILSTVEPPERGELQ